MATSRGSSSLSPAPGTPHIQHRAPCPPFHIFAMYDLTAVPILDESNAVDAPLGPETAPADDDRELLDAYSRAVIDVVDRIGPAVVRLDTYAGDKSRRTGSGSGVIVAPDRLV